MTIVGLVDSFKAEAKKQSSKIPFKTCPIASLSGKKVGVDMILFIITAMKGCSPSTLFNIASTGGGGGWLGRLLDMEAFFRENGVETIWLREGEAPEFKTKTKEKRRMVAQKNLTSLQNINKFLDVVHTCPEFGKLLVQYELTASLEEGELTASGVADTSELTASLEGDEPDSDMPSANESEVNEIYAKLCQTLQYKKGKLEQATLWPTKEDIDHATEVLLLSGSRVVHCEGEAEELGSYLTRCGVFDAVLSKDSDCAAYGATMWIKEFSIAQKNVTIFDRRAALKLMQLSEEEMVKYCVLRGCDFSERIGSAQKLQSLRCVREGCNLDGLTEKERKALNFDWCVDHFNCCHIEEMTTKTPIKITCGRLSPEKLRAKMRLYGGYVSASVERVFLA